MQGNLFYGEVRLPRNANPTGIYRDYWLNPVYLPYNPLIWSYIVSSIPFTRVCSSDATIHHQSYPLGVLTSFSLPVQRSTTVLLYDHVFHFLPNLCGIFSLSHLIGTEVLIVIVLQTHCKHGILQCMATLISK